MDRSGTHNNRSDRFWCALFSMEHSSSLVFKLTLMDVADVVTRLANALTVIESQFEDCAVLVVSHGDPLQILQTIYDAAKKPPSIPDNGLKSRIEAIRVPSVLSQHRKFAVNTGELRRLV